MTETGDVAKRIPFMIAMCFFYPENFFSEHELHESHEFFHSENYEIYENFILNTDSSD